SVRLAPENELMPDVSSLFEGLRRVHVYYGRSQWSHARIARLAARETRRSGSCLVVVNTKESARELYRLCSALVPGDVLFHLSTDMCPAHRAKSLGLTDSTAAPDQTILGRLKNGLPTLCISTQLIEAGIDVD